MPYKNEDKNISSHTLEVLLKKQTSPAITVIFLKTKK